MYVWRTADPRDDDEIVRMCVALNAENPGPDPVPAAHMQQTLQTLRKEPQRGRVAVLELNEHLCGYALLISFWSNELGGEVCVVDEIYVKPEHRGRQHATRLIEHLAARSGPFASTAVALTLEITPDNVHARRLYERLRFSGSNLAMRRRLKR
jgi:ribosomal protein S18 acetylase RimI-like enzyme